MSQEQLDTSFTTTLQAVQKLVAMFDAHKHSYMASEYSEISARSDFIDKFLIALGWDVRHDVQHDPLRQEVKVEKNVNVDKRQRRADYALYVAPHFRDIRLFIEAKKPSTSLATADNYFQAVRYGWNGGTPIVVLTNFLELHVLDCRYKPDIGTVLQCAIPEYRFFYQDYADKEAFAKIFFLLSRNAVAQNRIEEFATTLPKKRGKAIQLGLLPGGYQSVDEVFLAELDQHREALAKSLKVRNQWLDGDALTEITQRILDRLIFLRFLEDKLIEPDPYVSEFGSNKTIWLDFIGTCKKLDHIYNGAVFKHHQLVDSGKLEVDEEMFGSICEQLSHVNSPYDLNAIPIHILGSIYERFLGKVISTTEKRAKLEEKSEVRKAGGVYYTPARIVEYIVKTTVSNQLVGKQPRQIASLRFADIACGSGSFLLEVFDELIRYHQEWYIKNPTSTPSDAIAKDDGGRLHVSFTKKREILVNNIFGVDIDPQAVEVAKLSLYLKLLEEETTNSARTVQLEIHEAMLPSLTKNIVCGNSLVDEQIATDSLFGKQDAERLNPLDFTNAFPKVFESGGFDGIVGNPPYLFITELDEVQKDYFRRRYETAQYRFDVYALFIERSIKDLLKKDGYLGFIIPHTLLSNNSFERLREILLDGTSIEEVVDIGPGVFKGAKNETMILTVLNHLKRNHRIKVSSTTAELFPDPVRQFSVIQSDWKKTPRSAWQVHVSSREAGVLQTLESTKLRLGDLCSINQGLRTGDNDSLILPVARSSRWKPVVGGTDISRYGQIEHKQFVHYVPTLLDAARKPEIFESGEKILVQEVRNIRLRRRIVATYDDRKTYALQSTNVVNLKDGVAVPIKFILAIINSAAINFFFRLRFSGNNHIASDQLAEIPIPSAPKAERVGRVVNAVDRLISAYSVHEGYLTERLEHRADSEISAVEKFIDRELYQLWGLDTDQIRIIEEEEEGSLESLRD